MEKTWDYIGFYAENFAHNKLKKFVRTCKSKLIKI